MISHAWCFSNVIKRREVHLALQEQLTSNLKDWIEVCVYIELVCIIRLDDQKVKVKQFTYSIIAVTEKTHFMTALIIIQCDWLYDTAQFLFFYLKTDHFVKLFTLYLVCDWFCIVFEMIITWNLASAAGFAFIYEHAEPGWNWSEVCKIHCR